MLKGIQNAVGGASKMLQMKQQQEKMEKLMASISATGYSKNNKVSVTINGKQSIVSINIDKALINYVHETTTSKDNDDSLIAKCVMEAFEDAQKKIQPAMVKKMQESGDMSDIMSMLGGM
jgi:DNA-binding protein YbaB